MTRIGRGGDEVSAAEIEESVRLARQSIQWDKNDPDTLLMAAITLADLAGEYSTAASLIERAISINPNSAHAWNAKGWIAYRQNKLDTATEALKRAIRLSPLDPLGGYFSGGLALVNSAAGRYEEALEWAERSLQEFPTYTTVIRSKIGSRALDILRLLVERFSVDRGTGR